ncbi:hypothetical protein PoB_000387300 [Plakobranchus ocellatus]|uniref:Uncharacterized protein n=1 Tax=Plakobranchus ocellatus TaxID=259542 RepID=A0AAV3Y4P3_9GAST|nr:hypothetical protein PoB_000387300 [Plakobranchus ocellatus]
MASNGGDAASPSVANSEQTIVKSDNITSSKPDQPVSEAVPLRQEAAEDLSMDSKSAEVSQTSSSKSNSSDITNADNISQAVSTSATKSSAADLKEQPIKEMKNDTLPADNKISTPVSSSEGVTNGTEDLAVSTTTPKEDKPPATAAQLKPEAGKETPSESKSSKSTDEVPFWVHETGNKPTEAAEQQAAPVVPSKSESSAPPAAPSTKPEQITVPPGGTKPSGIQVKTVPPVATVAPMPKAESNKSSNGTDASSNKSSTAGKHGAESTPDGEAPPEKKAKPSAPSAAASSKSTSNSGPSSVAPTGGKTPQQILEYMNKTFEQRRRIITKQMPTIPELQQLYPDLFMHKQLLTEFQRITKIDIDQKIQEFCVRFATAVIEMARGKKGAAPVIARWENAQRENRTLKQYWDMMTALCLLPLHFGENFVDMVQEIGEDEEVEAQGKIVPVLVARGNIFKTDEFFLIAENTIVQEFEEFTIALASLYSSYWVFNMVYPESIENTYNYIQRCIVRQKEPGSIPAVCRNFTKALQKWNREKEGK